MPFNRKSSHVLIIHPIFFDQRHVAYPATNMQYQAMIEKNIWNTATLNTHVTCLFHPTIISAPETLNSTEQRWKLKVLDKVFVNDRYPKMEPPANLPSVTRIDFFHVEVTRNHPFFKGHGHKTPKFGSFGTIDGCFKLFYIFFIISSLYLGNWSIFII